MIKQNLGKLDRIFRFILAIWWLSPLAPKFYSPELNLLIYLIGWLALLESFLGWCWLMDLLGISNKSER